MLLRRALPTARQSLARPFPIYEMGSSEGTGERLVRKLDSTLENLKIHPGIAPPFEGPVRRLVIGSSGYGLFYSVETRGIIVHALIHLSQNPETIREKIRRLLRLD